MVPEIILILDLNRILALTVNGLDVPVYIHY